MSDEQFDAVLRSLDFTTLEARVAVAYNLPVPLELLRKMRAFFGPLFAKENAEEKATGLAAEQHEAQVAVLHCQIALWNEACYEREGCVVLNEHLEPCESSPEHAKLRQESVSNLAVRTELTPGDVEEEMKLMRASLRALLGSDAELQLGHGMTLRSVGAELSFRSEDATAEAIEQAARKASGPS